MIEYADLLGNNYTTYGNCYGLIEECCRRAGTPIDNPFKQLQSLPVGAEVDYIKGINARRIPTPKAGAIAECKTDKNLHVAYMLTDTLALHTTLRHGTRVTHINILNPIAFYEVEKIEN